MTNVLFIFEAPPTSIFHPTDYSLLYLFSSPEGRTWPQIIIGPQQCNWALNILAYFEPFAVYSVLGLNTLLTVICQSVADL